MDGKVVRKNVELIEENQMVEKAIREQSKLLAKLGCLSKDDAEYYARNWFNMMPSWQERKFQNAAALLDNYRELRWAISGNITDVAKESGLNITGDLLYENVHALVQEISDAEGCARDLTRLQSVIKSAELSVKLLQYADYALERVHSHPDNGQIMFDVLFGTYVSEESAVAFRDNKIPYYKYLKMSKTTYYENRRRGLKLFSKCIWGLSTMGIEDYIMLCMLVEKRTHQ